MTKRATSKAVFVTGIAGFAGSHLAEQLLEAGYQIYGALHPKESTAYLKGIKSNLELIRLDITNAVRVAAAVQKIKPQFVCHLAALASVWRSFADMQKVFRVNFEGTLNLLEAAHQTGTVKKLLFVGSAECYGTFSPKNKTLSEDQPLNPISPYALSKAVAEQACMYYQRRHRLPVTISRSFAHTGSRQSVDFVVPSFARQIAMIESSRRIPVLKVGNLSAKRDFSDVRDIVRGYRLMLEKGRPGRVYQLCSGRAVAIQTVLDMLLKMSARKIEIEIDRTRLRKSDIPVQRGSNSRAVQELGYASRYSLRETLTECLEYFRDQVQT
ncbi:MAG: GDP-mannose 4,6-dehydratase [candidate division Zixibacteria bacterium]|nr:GDP-mannose 4,6-dehydratase [candidate division Zixibacteria bacterium]MDH3937253.1 GDP-mannose 4,6-dehydratase [candidate division Zixibacteria bacterium]MDH4033287.1 GDP-mannose 4,6-dehydratase [candidate division Zixibacteria bacterium]